MRLFNAGLGFGLKPVPFIHGEFFNMLLEAV